MKRYKMICMAVLAMCLLVACVRVEEASSKQEYPFSVYEYEDSDGCLYVVTYASSGNGVGTGITQKVTQPPSCGAAQ